MQALDEAEIEDRLAALAGQRQQAVEQQGIVADLPHLGTTVLVGVLHGKEFVQRTVDPLNGRGAHRFLPLEDAADQVGVRHLLGDGLHLSQRRACRHEAIHRARERHMLLRRGKRHHTIVVVVWFRQADQALPHGMREEIPFQKALPRHESRSHSVAFY